MSRPKAKNPDLVAVPDNADEFGINALDEAAEEGRFEALGDYYNLDELAALPEPEPLIEGWLDLRTCVIAVGETGSNKTFGVLGWAASIATGKPWLGYPVLIEPSPVVFVVGEGKFGLSGRIKAWERSNDKKIPRKNFHVFNKPTSINDDPFWDDLTEFCQEHDVRFVVLDTFSSLAPTADETNDAALAISRLSRLSGDIDGTTVMTHHTGWSDNGRTRGGSQLEADPDGVILFRKHDKDDPLTPVEVWRKKNKEGPNTLKIWVEREEVEISEDRTSCVLQVTDAPVGGGSDAPATRRYSVTDASTLIVQAIEASPDKTKTFLIGTIAAEHAIGKDKLRDAFLQLEDQAQIISHSKQIMEGGTLKRRTVWALGEGKRVTVKRVSPA